MTDETFDLLDAHECFRQRDDELLFLNRLVDLQSQHPETKGRSIPAFLDEMMTWDDVRLLREISAMPIDTKSHDLFFNTVTKASWSDEDRLAFVSLQSESFELEVRQQSLRWEIDELEPHCAVNVSCPHCHDPMSRSRLDCRSGHLS